MWRTFKNAESRKIGWLFKRVLGAVPRPSIHYKLSQSSIQKEHDCLFKYFFGISIKEDKKKENRLRSEELL